MRIFLKIFLGFILLLILAFGACFLLTYGNYEVPKTVDQDPSIPQVEINGTKYHAETFGTDTSKVVIVIHGGPGNDYKYLLSLKELEDQYFVVFYDQRGSGLSPRVSESQLTLDQSIDDLNDIIEHYSKDNKVYLIGHSWGAMLASAYISEFPDKVKRVVLAEPGMLTKETARAFMERTNNMIPELSFDFLVFLGKTWFESLHISGPDNQASMDYMVSAIVNNKELQGNPTAGYFCDRNPKNGVTDGWRFGSAAAINIPKSGMDADGNFTIDLVDGVEDYKEKVLFLTSSCNSIIGEDHQKEHMRYFTNAEMVIVNDCGHTMFGEKPEESIAAVRKYFKEIEDPEINPEDLPEGDEPVIEDDTLEEEE